MMAALLRTVTEGLGRDINFTFLADLWNVNQYLVPLILVFLVLFKRIGSKVMGGMY